jgi:hypothetical protein
LQVIKRIGVISLAKIMGATGLLIGLLVGIPMGLFMLIMSLVGGAAAASSGDDAATGGLIGAGAGVGVALFTMVGIPLLYGATSFLFGLIYGLIVNLVFSMAGGLELEIENQKPY